MTNAKMVKVAKNVAVVLRGRKRSYFVYITKVEARRLFDEVLEPGDLGVTHRRVSGKSEYGTAVIDKAL